MTWVNTGLSQQLTTKSSPQLIGQDKTLFWSMSDKYLMFSIMARVKIYIYCKDRTWPHPPPMVYTYRRLWTHLFYYYYYKEIILKLFFILIPILTKETWTIISVQIFISVSWITTLQSLNLDYFAQSQYKANNKKIGIQWCQKNPFMAILPQMNDCMIGITYLKQKHSHCYVAHSYATVNNIYQQEE